MDNGKMGDVGAVVFDAYGTLFDIGSPVRRCADRLGDRAGALATVWRAKQLEYAWLRSLMHQFTDFWHITGDALDHAMAAVGHSDPVLRAELMQGYLRPDCHAKAHLTLEALRARGLRTAILSNGSTTMLKAAVNATGLAGLFDAVLSVDQVRIYKPDPSVYHLACERLGLRPAQIVFVTANGWDAAGATVAGLRAVLIASGNAPPELLPTSPETVIPDLGAVPALLA